MNPPNYKRITIKNRIVKTPKQAIIKVTINNPKKKDNKVDLKVLLLQMQRITDNKIKVIIKNINGNNLKRTLNKITY